MMGVDKVVIRCYYCILILIKGVTFIVFSRVLCNIYNFNIKLSLNWWRSVYFFCFNQNLFLVNLLSRVNEHEQEETDQRVMTLFPALNLEARVAADKIHTSHPKESYKDNFLQCWFKCRTNLGCLRRLFRVTILEDEV
ncbi:Hypothetical_protein [Hexamita inflata]|uniref:Hypothetical_protein n=1 Tax=Hexamita inflata TaxID=28002 RepID=A0AA86R056_9EUKA|nr:Hypothetical protein HINF_LOCUS52136 [Hexamita inflata]